MPDPRTASHRNTCAPQVIPETAPPAWLRIAYALCVTIAIAAVVLLLVLSVFVLPMILRWDAAHPWALLGVYLGFSCLGLIPFAAVVYLRQLKTRLRPAKPFALIGLAALFIAPAVVLIGFGLDGGTAFLDTAFPLMFGVPGVLCVALSMLLAHRAISLLRA